METVMHWGERQLRMQIVEQSSFGKDESYLVAPIAAMMVLRVYPTDRGHFAGLASDYDTRWPWSVPFHASGDTPQAAVDNLHIHVQDIRARLVAVLRPIAEPVTPSDTEGR